MKIACPNCMAEGKVKTDSPPEKDFMLVCPLCKEKFLVKINVRNHYRRKSEIPVRFSLSPVDLHNMKDVGDGIIADISTKGMSVEVYKNPFSLNYFKQGKLLTFSFSLPPRNEELKINGEIVRFREGDEGDYCNIGIQFINLDKFAEQQIGFFLLP